MSIDYERYEASVTPMTLTVQGDAGGFQVALVAHVDDESNVDVQLDRMRRSFIRQEAHMRLTLVMADLEQKRQELRDTPVVLEAIQRTYAIEHAEMIASFQGIWNGRNRLGAYKPSTTERANLDKLKIDADAKIAKVKAQTESLPLLIKQYEERIANLRNMIDGKDKHVTIEEAFARRSLVERPPEAAE
jgi:hypothetical protein